MAGEARRNSLATATETSQSPHLRPSYRDAARCGDALTPLTKCCGGLRQDSEMRDQVATPRHPGQPRRSPAEGARGIGAPRDLPPRSSPKARERRCAIPGQPRRSPAEGARGIRRNARSATHARLAEGARESWHPQDLRPQRELVRRNVIQENASGVPSTIHFE